MDMFNSVAVDTMLMKRRQKIFYGYEHLDNLLCQITIIIIIIIINEEIIVAFSHKTTRTRYNHVMQL